MKTITLYGNEAGIWHATTLQPDGREWHTAGWSRPEQALASLLETVPALEREYPGTFPDFAEPQR